MTTTNPDKLIEAQDLSDWCIKQGQSIESGAREELLIDASILLNYYWLLTKKSHIYHPQSDEWERAWEELDHILSTLPEQSRKMLEVVDIAPKLAEAASRLLRKFAISILDGESECVDDAREILSDYEAVRALHSESKA